MKLQYLKNVVTPQLNGERRIGCGQCLEVRPHQVFRLDAGKAEIGDRDSCMECGSCAGNCPAGAVTVRAGVGCATAILYGRLRGNAPCCGESDDRDSSCCG